jgi:hypothetical protein
VTFAQCEEAISARMSTVATAQAMTLVRDNAPEPADRAAKWARLRISATAADLISMGGVGRRRFRTRGQFVLELHAPSKQGASTLRTLGDAVVTAFRGVSLASPNIRFQPPVIGPIAEASGWSRRDVTVAFTFDEEG